MRRSGTCERCVYLDGKVDKMCVRCSQNQTFPDANDSSGKFFRGCSSDHRRRRCLYTHFDCALKW